MRGHVEAESLALYAEGQLGRRQTARVRAHLSGCPECAGTVAALADVTTQLSRVPAPPMPSAVMARLDAALSAEAAAPAPAPRPPRRNPLWSPRALRILATTGVTLVVAGGVGYAVSQFGSSGPGTSGAAAPASGTHHRPTVQAGPNVSPHSRLRKPNMSPNKPTPSSPRYVRSGTDYQPSTLAAQAKHGLAEYTVAPLSGPGQLTSAQVPVTVRTCVSQTAHGRQVLFVDLARYQQRPAVLIVLGHPDQAVVVNSSCAPLHSPVTVRG